MMLPKFMLIILLLGMVPSISSMANEDRDKDKDPRDLCFNVFCSYRREGGGGFESCEAGAIFIKSVTADGKEIWDRSERSDSLVFEVECDNRVVFNNSGHRYTDEQGTRIQAKTGPLPAVLLPKNTLRDGHRYVASALEIQGQSLPGYCYIYTGPQ